MPRLASFSETKLKPSDFPRLAPYSAQALIRLRLRLAPYSETELPLCFGADSAQSLRTRAHLGSCSAVQTYPGSLRTQDATVTHTCSGSRSGADQARLSRSVAQSLSRSAAQPLSRSDFPRLASYSETKLRLALRRPKGAIRLRDQLKPSDLPRTQTRFVLRDRASVLTQPCPGSDTDKGGATRLALNR